MPQTEKQTTATFLVEDGDDGSRHVVNEVTTYLIHSTGHRAPAQVDYFLDGESESLAIGASNPDVFIDYPKKKTYRKVGTN